MPNNALNQNGTRVSLVNYKLMNVRPAGRIMLSGLGLLIILWPRLSTGQTIDGEPIYHVLPKDAIPAIFYPVFVPAEQAAKFMAPAEQVIGVIGPAGTAVAYSTWYLDSHEIVNDLVDGLPLAVAW